MHAHLLQSIGATKARICVSTRLSEFLGNSRSVMTRCSNRRFIGIRRDTYLIVEKQYGSSEKEGRCSQQGGTERGGAQGSADARPQQTRPQSRSESWAQST